MRKTIFGIAALSTMILASCSNDSVIDNAPDNNTGAIGFQTVVDKNSRGVTDLTTANFGKFKVWGYESQSNDADNVVTRFNGIDVTKVGANWTYSPLQYWTVGNYYWFCGYNSTIASAAKFIPVGTSEWPTADVAPTGNKLFGGTMYFNNGIESWTTPNGDALTGANGDSDLLYAVWRTKNAVTKAPLPTVDFSFRHILSKVAFKFVNNMPYSTISVTDLKVNGVPAQGTLNMSVENPTWTVSGTPFVMDYTNDDIAALVSILPGNQAASDFNIFIPADFTYNIQFTVQVSQNGVTIATYTHSVNVSDLTLEMGRAYVLTATLDKSNIDPEGALQPIQFNPTVDDWVPAGADIVTPN